MPRPALAPAVLLAALAAAAPAIALDVPELLDPAAAAALLAEAAPDCAAGADRFLVFDRTVVDVEPSGLNHRYEHRLTKVLEPAGALALRSLRFDYDPASNMVAIRGVRVHRADSTWVDVDPALARDVTAPCGGICWGGRMKVLALPPLEVGDAVEVLSTTKGFLIAYLDDETGSPASGAGGGDPRATGPAGALVPRPAASWWSSVEAAARDSVAMRPAADEERYVPPMRGHFYDVVLFQDDLPARERRYTLRLPRGRPLQYSVYNGEVASSLTFEPEHFVYGFWREDVPALAHEPRMPDASDVVPKVVMATVADWEEKSRWFYETNEWVFASNPEIDAKVAEITAGLRSDDEKIAALTHWVAQNIRYFGITMGKGEGYTIHPGWMNFRDRCGVCKDIAGMLVTMLRAAGFETYAAMTMAGARVERIPADQFNHCVVALRRENGEYLMLDPTWVPGMRDLWSKYEGEQNYVIGSPEGEDLTSIRPFAPEENLLAVESEARILANGTLEGTLRLEGRGVADSRLRRAAGETEKRDVRNALEGWLGVLSERVELTELLFSDHEDFDRDTSLRLSYRIPGWAEALGDALRFRSPGLALVADNARFNRLALLPEGEERERDCFLWAGQLVTVDETIQLPRGWEAAAPEDLDESRELGHARLTWKAQGRKLSLAASISVDRRLIPAAQVPGLRAMADTLGERAESPLFAEK
ncbi:MAG: DUF3857 domain-containing protein [Candidatus Krumholzibacteriota bacterium]|nr:DUF3857 domain-containing protein [Candidatus Krumholzibacteriota bacterium]